MNIQRTAALAKKELYSSIHSPAFYGIGFFFLLSTAIIFFYIQRFFVMNVASLRSYFASFPLVYVLVIPVLVMKSWAEERRLGSAELLLTMPFTEWELVAGKFLSSLALIGLFLVLTIPVPLSLLPLGSFDGGVIFCEYLGAALLGSCAIALGHLLSALSKNLSGAFLGTAAVLLAAMTATQLTQIFELPPALASLINFFSLAFHYESFSKGIIDTRDLAFFVLATVIFLQLNAQVLYARRWR